MIKENNFFNSGYILFVSMALTLGATLIIASFMSSLPTETLRVNQRIAKTKALYNAETGIAQKAYPFLIRSDFTADTTLAGELIQDFSSNYNHGVDMGLYLNPKLSFSDSGQREAIVEGVSFIINSNGVLDSVKQTVSISARPETLAKYMYLTDSEKAGGAPFSWGPPGFTINQRRDVYFGVDDIMDGLVQSNSDISLSNSTTCANFSAATLYITNDTEINLGACGSYESLFGWGNDIDTVSSPPVKLPPTGYVTLKNNATILYDSGRKIGNGTIKDTLIMTDIEFFETGRVRVKQWWYLMPPHLKAGISENDLLISTPAHLDGVVADANDNLYYNNDGDNNPFDNPLDCSNFGDLRTCEPYIDSLYYFHGVGYDLDGTLNNMPDEWYSNNPNLETYISETIRGPYGINQHFDFQPLNSNGIPNSTSLIREDEYLISSPTVFYIKDGPVRVSGVYKGQFTVVTDEFTKYRRHAWNSIFNVKQDTVWNNIWIIDDLVNVDAISSGFSGNPNHSSGNLSDFQPSNDCQGGSSNIMGLVSGANVVIANTPENGARGCSAGGCNISINAAILALNESFVVHYGQNTTNQIASNVQVPDRFITGNTHNPPFGDGRGVERFGVQNTDKRQEIYLWGSVVQKHRGYMLRNPNSPYGTFGYEIGMDKNYHYDKNLFCTSPPFFPAVEYDDGTGEIGVSLTSFKKIN